MHDFFDHKKIQRLQDIELEYDEDIEEGVKLLTAKLSLQPAPCPDIESFALYKSFQAIGVVETYRSTFGEFDLAVYQIQYAYTSGSGRHSNISHNQCFLGLLSLFKDYPRTAIFKENMQTRINDWFSKQDVDFKEHRKFSRQFHVVTNDKTKLEQLLYNRPLDELTAFPEMEAELHGRYCLFKVSGDPVSEYSAEQLAELAKRLYRILGGL